MLLLVPVIFFSLVVAAPFNHLPIRDDGAPAWLEGSAPTLFPSHSWDHDLYNVDNLTPKNSHVLYYTDSGSYDPSIEHLFATIETSYHYQAVATSHTKYIHSISCIDQGSLEITFNDKNAYNHVKKHWTLTDGQKWVLVTHTSGCFNSRDGQNTFWLVSQVAFEGDDGSLKVKLCVEEVAIGHCASEVELTWGTHQPIVSGSQGWPNSGTDPSASSHTLAPSTTPGLPSPGTSSSPSSASKPSADTSLSRVSTPPGSQPSAVPPSQNTTECGVYPGSTYLGFPTAPCGEDFDIKLDAIIGYYPFESGFSSDLRTFAPGLDTYALAEYENDSTDLAKRERVMRALNKRGFWKKLKKAFNKVVNVVKTKVVPVITRVIAVAKKIQAAAVKVAEAVKAAIRALDNLGGDYGPKPFTFERGLDQNSDSPWGRQYLIYQAKNSSSSSSQSNIQGSSSSSAYSIGLWCVDCNVTAKAVVAGSARFSLVTSQVRAAFVQVSGSFGFNVALGADATAFYHTEYQKTLLSLPIPGTSFVIPGVLIFGGQASIGVSAFATARAAGRILVGGNVGIPNYVARLDAVHVGSSGVSGFTPVLRKTFDAQGALDMDIGLGLPIEIGFGISLPAVPDFGPKVIGLRDTPEYVANARGVYNNGWQTIDGCRGIPYKVDFHNRLDADAFGKIYPLARQDRLGIFKGCIELGSAVSSSSRSSSIGRPSSSTRDVSSNVQSASSSLVTYSSYASNRSGFEPSSYMYTSSITSSYSYSSNLPTSISDCVTESDSNGLISNCDRSSSSRAGNVPSTSATSESLRRGLGRFNRRQEDSNSSSISPDALAFLENDAQLVADGNADLLAIAIQQEAELSTSAPDFDGAQYAAIMDVSGTYGLVGDSDGVLRFVDKETASALPWTTFDAISVSDAQDRVLHYYPAQIARFGVSRLRIQTVDLLPLGSEISALVPISADANSALQGTFVPVNTAADAFYPIFCNLAGQKYSKMFLATDVDEGIKTLLKPELRYILTGGVVTDCGVVQLVSSQSPGLGV